MDNLTYAYSGNRLNSVSDAISTNNELDFVPRGNNAYTYYPNGALKSDANEQIANIVYNTYLNQPSEVFLTDGRKIKHHYDGSGTLFKTEYFNSSGTVFETYHYIDGLIYKNGAFFQIGIPEGRVIFNNGAWHYEFDYKDHLGNTRVSFKADENTLVQTAKSDFDPFGVVLRSSQVNDFQNRFELQSKERDLTFGLNWVNFGARRMNPTTGRMDNIDAMASKFASHSLYNYTLNNPLNVIDPDGNESRDIWGNTTFNGFVGDDGSGNFVGSTGGGGDDKEKGKKKEEEKKTSREKALEVKGKGFWEFMNFAFSTDGLSFLIDEIYKVEGSGNLAENAHPIEKANELVAIYATGKLFVTIGKGSGAFKKSIEIPKGFRETGQFRKVGAAKAPILTNGKVFISPDLTEHNTEGWKMAKTIKELGNKTTRTGTFDSNLNFMKK